VDFNLYDFHGNPRPLKGEKEEWCKTCLMYTPTNQHLMACDICGEAKSNKPIEPTVKGGGS